ncbi:MAG: GGDEF domain-containing protein [Clostridia bacterium]|nr:GGDEF domain-containing protein [Clostridia bacterium]
MISAARKKIAVFINQSDGNFEHLVHHFVQRRARELNYDVYYFCTVGTRHSMNTYDLLERGMFSFAPVEQFDGIIATPTSYEMSNTQQMLMDMLETRAKCPVVLVRASDIPGYCCVATDEKHAIRPLIRHLIDHHKLTKIAFMAGYQGHADSEIRLACYLDEMKKHNLPLTDRSVFYGDMWKGKGEEAFHYFFDDWDNRPEAVVCASDYMAGALLDALRDRNIKVPEDVIVTGFDNVSISEFFQPPLSTVTQDYEVMITTAVDLLDQRIREKAMGIEAAPMNVPIPGLLVLRDSCGCVSPQKQREREVIISQHKRIEMFGQREISQTYFSTLLNSCNTLEDMHEVIWRKLPDVPHIRSFFMCLFRNDDGSDSMAETLTDNVQLAIAIKNMKDCGMPKTVFDKSFILPYEFTQDDEPQAYFIMLLHKQNSTFGYSVLQYDPDYEPTSFYHHWNVIISNALSNYSNQQKLRALYEERRLSSITDMLTKLNNRRGLEEKLLPIWPELVEKNSMISFVSYDLNGLKYINDNFGHLDGDFALAAVSEAIRQVTPPNCISARMGGDEFLTALPGYNEEQANAFLEKYNAALMNINMTSGKPYSVSASLGMFVVQLDQDITLSDCLRQSDAKMYQAKSKLKRRREDRV